MAYPSNKSPTWQTEVPLCQKKSELDHLDPDVNLENVKEKFQEEAEKYYNDDKSRSYQYKRWTQVKIRKTISKIKKANSRLAARRLLTKHQQQLRNQYDLLVENGKEVLIFKKICSKECNKRVAAFEDIFDILDKAHRSCEHGGPVKTTASIKPSYHIPRALIDIFVELCNVCKKSKNGKVHRKSSTFADPTRPATLYTNLRFNHTAQVGFIDMKKQTDGPFNQLLYYVDKVTYFSIMRPLESYKNEIEVATEMLNIFADFGLPLRVQTYFGELICRSLNILKAKFPSWAITVVQMPEDFKTITELMMNLLQQWMMQNDCNHWSIGCRMIQFKTNITKVEESLYSPYKTVFKHNSNCRIFKVTNKGENIKKQKSNDRIKVNKAINKKSVTKSNIEIYSREDTSLPSPKRESPCDSSDSSDDIDEYAIEPVLQSYKRYKQNQLILKRNNCN